MDTKSKIAAGFIVTISVLVIIFLFLYGLRAFNSYTVQHKIITPKDGIECVVVSATDSTSVDCWKVQP